MVGLQASVLDKCNTVYPLVHTVPKGLGHINELTFMYEYPLALAGFFIDKKEKGMYIKLQQPSTLK